MKEEHYLIKEAATKVGVETHVLRYWEEELNMDIRRNEMGHRYYTKKDIEILSKVKTLKEKGLQLKAIRNYLEKRKTQIAAEKNNKEMTEQEDSLHKNEEESVAQKAELVSVKSTILTNEQKMEQFQMIMNRIMANAIRENNELIGQSAGEQAAKTVAKEIYGMTKEQEERAEARYRKLDQTLREIQQARQEAAAANMRPVDKRKQKRLKRKATHNGQADVKEATASENEEQDNTSTDSKEE